MNDKIADFVEIRGLIVPWGGGGRGGGGGWGGGGGGGVGGGGGEENGLGRAGLVRMDFEPIVVGPHEGNFNAYILRCGEAAIDSLREMTVFSSTKSKMNRRCMIGRGRNSSVPSPFGSDSSV